MDMIRQMFKFASVVLIGLGAGIACSHLLQWSSKTALTAEEFLVVQQTLYINYGPVGTLLEPLTVLMTAFALVLSRTRSARTAGAIALLCLVGELAIWFVFIDPINREVMRWTPSTMPITWADYGLDQWHFFHAIRFLLYVGALASIAIAAQADRPREVIVRDRRHVDEPAVVPVPAVPPPGYDAVPMERRRGIDRRRRPGNRPMELESV
jgi:hypothetical protein